MKKRFLLIPLILYVLLGLASCDIHEYPHGEHDVDVALNLVFDYDLPQYKIIEYTTRSREEEYPNGIYPFVTRYIVDFYIEGNKGPEPDYRFTFEGEDVEDLNRTEHVLVAPARYKILVWTDFVSKEDKTPFYDVNDMKNIAFHGDDPDVTHYTGDKYTGNEDFQDAFRGEQDLDLSAYNKNDSHVEATVDMKRPLAKFNVVATDRDELIAFWIKQMEARGIPTKDGADAVDLSLFNIRIFYNGYFPSLFNNWNDRPVSSDTGLYFDGKIRERSDGDVELAFDYVMVNGKESSINISIAIYDDQWEEISVIQGIDLPLMRSHLTTVKGKFLTNGAQSGISINPEYDGEYNVYINM